MAAMGTSFEELFERGDATARYDAAAFELASWVAHLVAAGRLPADGFADELTTFLAARAAYRAAVRAVLE